MATISTKVFGTVMTMVDHLNECEDLLIRLNFDLGLDDNFTMGHFVDALFEGMSPDNQNEVFIEFTQGLNLNDGFIVISADGSELNTCVSDFMDFTRRSWSEYCENNYSKGQG